MVVQDGISPFADPAVAAMSLVVRTLVLEFDEQQTYRSPPLIQATSCLLQMTLRIVDSPGRDLVNLPG
ncbi:hypothetical protein BK635_01340 [Pseudomonas chlororaphis]|uniref:hypothetical protein n=1 Tax=Pseudomonas chlororaphis TaxID=587753 RepID=UPI000F47650C|nr:hypothetical protein [Pseudomonas chlororaphis]RON92051.1 hypothetical protein BK635_01340 [Pseudomonas chlororaphis]